MMMRAIYIPRKGLYRLNIIEDDGDGDGDGDAEDADARDARDAVVSRDLMR